MTLTDPRVIWRRKLRVGGHWWAERRDATWVRWSWLHADWEDMPGPPEGVRPAPPEGSVVAAPPVFARTKPGDRTPRTLPDRFLEYLLPALMIGLVGGGLLTAGALVWNGLVGPWLGMIPIHSLWLYVGVTCLVATIVLVALELVMIRLGKGIRELFTPGPKGRRR